MWGGCMREGTPGPWFGVTLFVRALQPNAYTVAHDSDVQSTEPQAQNWTLDALAPGGEAFCSIIRGWPSHLHDQMQSL